MVVEVVDVRSSTQSGRPNSSFCSEPTSSRIWCALGTLEHAHYARAVWSYHLGLVVQADSPVLGKLLGQVASSPRAQKQLLSKVTLRQFLLWPEACAQSREAAARKKRPWEPRP